MPSMTENNTSALSSITDVDEDVDEEVDEVRDEEAASRLEVVRVEAVPALSDGVGSRGCSTD